MIISRCLRSRITCRKHDGIRKYRPPPKKISPPPKKSFFDICIMSL
jgi:hypothetical protein